MARFDHKLIEAKWNKKWEDIFRNWDYCIPWMKYEEAGDQTDPNVSELAWPGPYRALPILSDVLAIYSRSNREIRLSPRFLKGDLADPSL